MSKEVQTLVLLACAVGTLGSLASAACSRIDPETMPKMFTPPDLAPTEPPPPPLVTMDGKIADAIAAALPQSSRGTTWADTTGNQLPAQWLIQSPPATHFGKGYGQLPIDYCFGNEGCDSDLLRFLCRQDEGAEIGGCRPLKASVTVTGQAPGLRATGHSDHVFDEMYKIMASGEQLVDVTSLSPPSGSYLGALRNAITYLASSGRRVTVRLLFGTVPGEEGPLDSLQLVKDLTRDVEPGAPIRVYAGYFQSTFKSWNHAKIVAADGKSAMVGGHNLYNNAYLREEPVHDLSMLVSGPAAGHAHTFASREWRYLCAYANADSCATRVRCVHHRTSEGLGFGCPPEGLAPPPSPTPGGVRVLGVGRLGDISFGDDPSDQAQMTLLAQAQRTIEISQQDIGPVKIIGELSLPWPDDFMREVGAAMVRGVDVYIVLSNPGAAGGYSNGWSLENVVSRIHDYLRLHPPRAVTGQALVELICSKLHVAPLRFSDEDVFPSGNAFGNHAKLVMVDGQAFYIGSQNLYPAGLAEYGYIVDNKEAASTLQSLYYTPLWRHSSRAAITGNGLSPCSLTRQME